MKIFEIYVERIMLDRALVLANSADEARERYLTGEATHTLASTTQSLTPVVVRDTQTQVEEAF